MVTMLAEAGIPDHLEHARNGSEEFGAPFKKASKLPAEDLIESGPFEIALALSSEVTGAIY